MQIEKSDILVIGAGVIGSSVAMHLALKGARVRVIDFDLEGSLSSSELNAGGVRGTWNQPVNIQMSKLSIDYFAEHAEEVGYRACGYLWLQTPEKMPAALKSRELQRSMNWEVEAWDIAELRRKIPFIDKTDDLAGAIYGVRDGLLNPNRLKNHYREKARERGATFDDRSLIRSSEYLPNGKIRVVCDRYGPIGNSDDKAAVLTGSLRLKPVGQIAYEADQIVNCAGAWAAEVARALHYDSPCFPVRRQICIFDCRDVDLTHYGMIIDTSGVYFHPEATNGLAGFAPKDEPRGFNYSYDGEAFFTEAIWPALYERSSKFERLKHMTGWAGLYDVSPDDSAIIGKAAAGAAGKSGRVFEAHSFSGHGVMHCHAAGLLLAERMTEGKYQTMDIENLSADRFANGHSEKLIRESAII